jgi:hypothetical protein
MIGRRLAEQMAQDWIHSWNRHDLDGIMAPYAKDIAFTSPLVSVLANEPSGTLHGAKALREYFAKGLAAYPDLQFELIDVLTGVASVTLYYRSVNGKLAAEVMHLNTDGLIVRVDVHYRESDDGGERDAA